jgi:AhpD family alkylhydroperoxidase
MIEKLAEKSSRARVRPLQRSELSPELQKMAESCTEEELGHLRIAGHVPEIALARMQWYSALKNNGRLPRKLIELVRLRLAYHNQCAHCMAIRMADGVADGVTETIVCELEKPEEAPDLDAREKLALRYADLVATNHFAIDDEFFAELHRLFTEPEIVELGITIGALFGQQRINVGWNFVDDLPERYQETRPGEIRFGSDTVKGPMRLPKEPA